MYKVALVEFAHQFLFYLKKKKDPSMFPATQASFSTSPGTSVDIMILHSYGIFQEVMQKKKAVKIKTSHRDLLPCRTIQSGPTWIRSVEIGQLEGI